MFGHAVLYILCLLIWYRYKMIPLWNALFHNSRAYARNSVCHKNILMFTKVFTHKLWIIHHLKWTQMGRNILFNAFNPYTQWVESNPYLLHRKGTSTIARFGTVNMANNGGIRLLEAPVLAEMGSMLTCSPFRINTSEIAIPASAVIQSVF